jgi:hypothetical protein
MSDEKKAEDKKPAPKPKAKERVFKAKVKVFVNGRLLQEGEVYEGSQPIPEGSLEHFEEINA